MKTTNQILGERLKQLREKAEMSITDLARKMETSRSHISEIEKGTKPFTGELYDRLVRACNSTPEAAFAGLGQIRDQPEGFGEFYWMLDQILSVAPFGDEGKRIVDGIRLNLEAISEKALKFRKGQKTRGSPTFEQGTGSQEATPIRGDVAVGDPHSSGMEETRRPPTTKKKRKYGA